MKVGFIGVGAMGSGMARNLIKAGHKVTVYNRTRSRADELKTDGATVADTAGQAAAGAEAVFTMLADDYALEEVTFGPGKLLESLPQGSIHLSASTISVQLSRRLTAAHREKRQHYLAAPVFGQDLPPLLELALARGGPTAIRFPRATVPDVPPALRRLVVEGRAGVESALRARAYDVTSLRRACGSVRRHAVSGVHFAHARGLSTPLASRGFRDSAPRTFAHRDAYGAARW